MHYLDGRSSGRSINGHRCIFNINLIGVNMDLQQSALIAAYKREVEELSTEIDRLNETLSAAKKQNDVQSAQMIDLQNRALEKNLQVQAMQKDAEATNRIIAKQGLVMQQLRDSIEEKDSKIHSLNTAYENSKELDKVDQESWMDVHWAHQSREMLIEELHGDIRNAKQQVADYQKLSEAESQRASLLNNILTTKAMAERYAQNLLGLHLELGHAESIAEALHAKLKTEDGDCDESN